MRTQQTYTKKQPERKGISSFLGYLVCVMAPFLRKAASLFLTECANPYCPTLSMWRNEFLHVYAEMYVHTCKSSYMCVLYNIDKVCSHQTLPGDF